MCCLETSKKRFIDFARASGPYIRPSVHGLAFEVKKSQKEKQFMQSCRLSTLDKQVIIKALALGKGSKTCTGGHHQVAHRTLGGRGSSGQLPQRRFEGFKMFSA